MPHFTEVKCVRLRSCIFRLIRKPPDNCEENGRPLKICMFESGFLFCKCVTNHTNKFCLLLVKNYTQGS